LYYYFIQHKPSSKF